MTADTKMPVETADPAPFGFPTAFLTLAFDPLITMARGSLSSAGICSLSQSSWIWARSPSHTASFCDFCISSCSKERQWLRQRQQLRGSPSGLPPRDPWTAEPSKYFYKTEPGCVLVTAEHTLSDCHCAHLRPQDYNSNSELKTFCFSIQQQFNYFINYFSFIFLELHVN